MAFFKIKNGAGIPRRERPLVRRPAVGPLNPTARIAKNSLVQLIGGLLGKILGVLLVIYAARQLGAEGFGVYSFVLSMVGIFYIFTDFGLGMLTVRELSKHPKEESRYLGNVMAMRLVLSLAAGAGMVACVAALGHPAAVVNLTAIIALSLFFSSNVDTCSAIFFAHERMEIPALVSVLATMLRVGTSLGALAAGAGVLSLIWIFVLASALQWLLLMWLLLHYMRPVFQFNDWPFWKKLLKQAYPIALANLFSIIYFKIDTVMLASFSGERAVGLYNAAYRLLEFTMILPAYYGGAVFPVISSSQSSNHPRFLLIYRRSVKYMLVASVPLSLGVLALAPGIIETLYGQAYQASVPVLLVLIWSLVLISVNSINAPYLISMGRQKTVSVLVAIGMVLNVGMNLYAIPRYGIMGAAWVTLLSEILNVVLFIVVLSKPLSLQWKMLRHGMSPLLAGVLMYGGLRLIPHWDLGFQIALGGIAYVVLLLLFQAFDEVDKELFGRVLRPTWFGGTRLT